MRGTLSKSDKDFRFFRITPAYAGNTKFCPVCFHDIQDHPRVCGEHTEASLNFAAYVGSPPRMRGTRI